MQWILVYMSLQHMDVSFVYIISDKISRFYNILSIKFLSILHAIFDHSM